MTLGGRPPPPQPRLGRLTEPPVRATERVPAGGAPCVLRPTAPSGEGESHVSRGKLSLRRAAGQSPFHETHFHENLNPRAPTRPEPYSPRRLGSSLHDPLARPRMEASQDPRRPITATHPSRRREDSRSRGSSGTVSGTEPSKRTHSPHFDALGVVMAHAPPCARWPALPRTYRGCRREAPRGRLTTARRLGATRGAGQGGRREGKGGRTEGKVEQTEGTAGAGQACVSRDRPAASASPGASWRPVCPRWLSPPGWPTGPPRAGSLCPSRTSALPPPAAG